MRVLCLLVVIYAIALAVASPLLDVEPTYSIKVIRPLEDVEGMQCEVVHFGKTQLHKMLLTNSHVISKVPLVREDHGHDHTHVGAEDGDASALHVFEVFSHKVEVLRTVAGQLCPNTDLSSAFVEAAYEHQLAEADEVVAIVSGGPSSNRIDVMLMGDGYTTAQRTQFFSDMTRLTKEMFEDITFKSYLPLFNVWALFRPSVESGVGINGRPKNTAFGLYRDGSELRGLYCSKTTDARSACSATKTCDYPSLIGNDDYYGGLGGEFTISTRSATSGTVVLRHEMGHNFGQVGEEYDGGTAYFGANSATTVAGLGWKHWLTEPTRLVAEQSAQRVQSYAWYDLAKGPFTITFTSDGTWSKVYLIFSASGCEEAGALKVSIDGVPVPWTPALPGSLDRHFYPTIWLTGFPSGTHRLVFEQGTAPKSGQIRQLCNVNMHEYKNNTLYRWDNEYVGAYPTWNSAGRVSYRPDNEKCLMRNMTSPIFCAPCQETIWHQFFKRITLVDALNVTSLAGSVVAVNMTVIPLAQFRPVRVPGETYVVSWLRAGVEDTTLRNVFSWTRARSAAVGSWTVNVRFSTPEVRSDPQNLLYTSKTFNIAA